MVNVTNWQLSLKKKKKKNEKTPQSRIVKNNLKLLPAHDCFCLKANSFRQLEFFFSFLCFFNYPH